MTKLTFQDWSELVRFQATFILQREHCAMKKAKLKEKRWKRGDEVGG